VSDRVTLLATNEKGILKPDDQWLWTAALSQLPSRVRVTVERERKIRTLKQNSRYWSAIVPMVAAVLSIDRPLPLSNDQAHELLKQSFNGLEDTALGKVGKSTRGLTTVQFAEYCEKIEAHFATEFGASIPEETRP
jgi:hypothetical protein